MNFHIGVFAIITDDQDRVLMSHRRDYDLWNLPGGRVEKGEVPWEALVREVDEEIGLKVEVKKLMGIYSKPQKDEIVFCFVCDVVSGELKESDEADRHEYFVLNDIPKNSAPKQVERIKQYFGDKEKTFFEKQEGLSSIEILKNGGELTAS